MEKKKIVTIALISFAFFGLVLILAKMAAPLPSENDSFSEEASAISEMVYGSAIYAFSESLVEGYECTNTFSTSYYSSKIDEKAIDRFRVIDSAEEFNEWQKTYCDMKPVTQVSADRSLARMEAGYIALIIAPTEIQICQKDLLVYGIYKNDKGDAVIVITPQNRNPQTNYEKDLSEWKKTYCVVFLQPDFLSSLNSLSFAIRGDALSREECGTI